MLRSDNVICGTSTTGTGTLTLAACPSPPGGLDFYQWLTATGIGFVNGNAVLVSYTIIEYTDATFTTAKATEKGVGTLTLGASLTASTLARTTVQSKVTGMNAAGPTPTFSAPTAFSIGTAANTLVFVGASASDVIAIDPYVVTSAPSSGDAFGASSLVAVSASTVGWTGATAAHLYTPFIWPMAMLAKRITVVVGTAFAGTTCNCWARLYAIGTNGQPGKLLYDFGVFGTAGSSLNSTGAVDNSTGGLGSGYFMTPGSYIMDFALATAGKTVSPLMRSTQFINYNLFGSNLNLANDPSGCGGVLNNSNTPTSTPNDPADVTAFTIVNQTGVAFWLKAS